MHDRRRSARPEAISAEANTAEDRTEALLAAMEVCDDRFEAELGST